MYQRGPLPIVRLMGRPHPDRWLSVGPPSPRPHPAVSRPVEAVHDRLPCPESLGLVSGDPQKWTLRFDELVAQSTSAVARLSHICGYRELRESGLSVAGSLAVHLG